MLKITLLILTATFAANMYAQVGIGTTTPGMQLHVRHTDSAVAMFENSKNLAADISTGCISKPVQAVFLIRGLSKPLAHPVQRQG